MTNYYYNTYDKILQIFYWQNSMKKRRTPSFFTPFSFGAFFGNILLKSARIPPAKFRR